MSLHLATCRHLTKRYPTLPGTLQSSASITTSHTRSLPPRPFSRRKISTTSFRIVKALSPNIPKGRPTSQKHTSSHRQQHRAFSTSPVMTDQPQKKDWSATQYLKFGNERTRAVYDLLSQVAPHITCPNPRIYDLGKPSISNTYT